MKNTSIFSLSVSMLPFSLSVFRKSGEKKETHINFSARTNLSGRGRMLLMAGALIVGGLSINVNYSSAAPLGNDQAILFRTQPDIPSHCIIRNGTNTITIPTTPYRMTIPRGVSKIEVECMSNNGIWRGIYQKKAKFNTSAIASLPWEAFQVANQVGSDFSEDNDETFGAMMKYPSTIVVDMTSSIKTIPDAQVISEEEAIANAPQAPVSAKTTPVAGSSHKVVHHVKAHHVRSATSADKEGNS